MEATKTRLQIIREQLSEKMARAIVEAIEDGAKIEKRIGAIYVDNVLILTANKQLGTGNEIMLHLEAPEIDALFEPDREELTAKAERLRAELTEIENKLNS